MKETMIPQIPISNATVQEYRNIVTAMANKGYEISDSLKEIKSDDYITAILIDNARKKVFPLGPALMAAWCGGYQYPLNAKQFFQYCDKLILHPDTAFYEQLIRTNRSDILTN